MIKDKDFNFKVKGDKVEFTINTKIYSLTAIYQAAYNFLDKVYIFLDGDPDKEIKMVMKIKPDPADPSTKLRMTASVDLEALAGEFYNELLNQLLRSKVNQTSAKIREYVVAKALYSAVPNEVDQLLQEVEEEDWQTDPLGIAKTWNESSSAPADAKALAGKKATEDKQGKENKKHKK